MKLLISSVLIICAFFLGVLFAEEKYEKETNEIKNQKTFVNIEIKNKKLNIVKKDNKVIILINWQENFTWSLEFK